MNKDEYDVEIQGLKVLVDNVLEDWVGLSDKCTLVEAERDGLKENLLLANEWDKQQQAVIDALNEEATSLKTEVASLKENVASLNDKIAALEADADWVIQEGVQQPTTAPKEDSLLQILLSKRVEALGRSLTWAETVIILAIATNMTASQKAGLLVLDSVDKPKR